jgi:hypothetical protein
VESGAITECGTMNQADLVDAVTSTSGLTKGDAAREVG